MDDDKLDLGALRKQLLAQQQLLENLAATADAATETVELDQTRVGRVSRMDALQQQAMSQETMRRRQLELQRIKSALQRLDNYDFGYCTHCEEPISPQRLAIDPTVLLCIQCASKAEQ